VLASLRHVYHPKSLKNDKYFQDRAQCKIEECIPPSSKKDEVFATPDEDSKHNGLILMIVRQKEKDTYTYTYTVCPQTTNLRLSDVVANAIVLQMITKLAMGMTTRQPIFFSVGSIKG